MWPAEIFTTFFNQHKSVYGVVYTVIFNDQQGERKKEKIKIKIKIDSRFIPPFDQTHVQLESEVWIGF